MLTELRVKNFALVEDLTLDLSGSLVVLTGETGAGKSILIDAIRFVLGERLDAIRFQNQPGKNSSVEAVFEITDPHLLKLETLKTFLDSEENLLILRREIQAEGKGRSWINQKTVNTSVLKEVGSFLLDIHGQYDHQLLLESGTQRQILDRFGKLEDEVRNYQQPFEDYTKLCAHQKDLELMKQGRERELDLLSYQINEIEKVELVEGEEEKLQHEKIRLANAEKLHESCQKILQGLDIDDESASTRIGQSARDLGALCKLDDSMTPLQKDLETAHLGLEEVIRAIRDYQENLSFEEGGLNEIQDRLDQIKMLKKKYGATTSAILEFLKKSKERFELLSNSEHAEEDLARQIGKIEPRLTQLAKALSQNRQKAALLLKKQIEQELKDLEMPNAVFDAQILVEEHFGKWGKDQIEFLIGINKGQDKQPLRKVVSAGETSRVMLALKKVLANADSVPTMIFDEIDANIGGRLGTVTGQKLRDIAKERQVLLITHLPQIASFADKHIKVSKATRAGKTVALYEALKGDVRIKELSEMMSGKKETEISKKHAEEMLAKAQR